MPSRFSWACVCAILPLTAAGAARAEIALPDGESATFRMAATAGPIEEAEPLQMPRRVEIPLAMPLLSSRYGYRPDPLGGGRRFHAGIDIPGPTGAPVLASAAGVVTFAGIAGGYGRMVEIDHGAGLRTRYAHLSRLLVAPGMQIGQGAIVGKMGSTGRSTGPHLHFEVRRDGRTVDPLAYLSRGALPPLPSAHRLIAGKPHVSAFAKARDEALHRGAPR
ncbi:MAG TPA: M23 family metallopeptidase [Croceibacterium sp.]|nr:M23 family metallopeptidase [Croceibacterium sp.]